MPYEKGLFLKVKDLFIFWTCPHWLKYSRSSFLDRLNKNFFFFQIFTFTRLLLFSNVKLDEQQKQQAIQSLSLLQNDFFVFNENTRFAWSSEEEINDDKIEKEIFDNWPSHLIFFQKEKERKPLGSWWPFKFKK
ncbi:unnamed protein product [Meloidogyne enterolobii]|uniref:Uncharacterized protein n=1 Tax=Meloidogyne enterolobii TaxID=390850 RepID=A0ACB0YQK0_MELEN